MQTETNKPKKTAPGVTRELAIAIGDIRTYREAIARLLAEAGGWPESIVASCDANGWECGVAFDLREALFKLGCVLGTLSTWEEDAGLTNGQIRQIDRMLHEGEEE